MKSSAMNNRHRSLDTLRAAAILMVIFAHTILSYGAPEIYAPLQIGGVGVDLFFVLSGWLLGGLLFREVAHTEVVDIKRFWLRRWMRTFPAYYVVLILTIAQQYLTKDDPRFPVDYFFFVQNYSSGMEILYVSWSLAVEEQFYLLIAPFIAFSTRFNRRTTLIILFVAFLTPQFFRFIDPSAKSIESHVRVDGCIAGVLLSYIHVYYRDFWERLCKHANLIGIASLIIFSSFIVFRYFPSWNVPGPNPLVLVTVFSCWVLYANSSSERMSRIGFPFCQYIATRSYAMYLLHPEALALGKKMLLILPFPAYFIACLLITLAISELLYRLVELPFMNMREKYKSTKSTKGTV